LPPPPAPDETGTGGKSRRLNTLLFGHNINGIIRLEGANDHEDTPDDGPDPANEGKDELEDTDDDISDIAIESTSDEGTNAEEEAVDDTEDKTKSSAARSLKASSVGDDITSKTHC